MSKKIIKDEKYYLTKLPTCTELKIELEEDIKLLKDMYNRLDYVPKVIRDNIEDHKIPKIKERIYYKQLAIDMCVRGFILGKRQDQNISEQRLYKALFGNEEKDNDTTSNN